MSKSLITALKCSSLGLQILEKKYKNKRTLEKQQENRTGHAKRKKNYFKGLITHKGAKQDGKE